MGLWGCGNWLFLIGLNYLLSPLGHYVHMSYRGSTDDLLLLQISSGVVWQTRDLHLSRNMLYLLSPRLCFFIVLKRDLSVYPDDSLTS